MLWLLKVGRSSSKKWCNEFKKCFH